jgi:hypothetical protein
MNSVKLLFGSLALVGLGMGLGWSVKPIHAQPEKPSFVYEVRTYTTEPGRLPALHARVRDHTVKLFEKHGMKNVVYLTPIDSDGKPVDNKLVYLLAHESEEAAKESFAAFRKDPDWLAAKEASEKAAGGSLTAKERGVVSEFLEATDYSPLK